jgi:hypothetical protein
MRGIGARWSSTLAAVVASTVAAGAAQAQPMTFAAFLTNGQEAPTVPILSMGDGGVHTGIARPTSFGLATFALNAAHTQLTMDVTIFNIDVGGGQTPGFTNDNLVNAHIHACGLPVTPSCPVRWGFFGAPDNDNNPDQLVVTPLGGGLVGARFTSIWDAAEGNGGTTLAAQLPNIIAGRSYINFHTIENPGGEIRGVLLATPEPSTYALMASGLGMVGILGWRRRRSA